ncbi:MAG: DUF1585 domain-containing protein [Deltaproteobacteria bacterium]|jgi:hypothetical protein|nr:DUF1585 domain-containing protein [Deltaproteobacteria bacterium]
MKMKPLLLGVVWACCATTPAFAQVCEETNPTQAALHYLRRLSLDLRGRLPNVTELESVVTNGALDPAIIDEMLASEAFVGQIRRHHRDLLWANVGNVRLGNNNWNLRGSRNGNLPISVGANGRMTAYRGGVTSCLDEPATFGPSGEILTTPDPNNSSLQLEGYVLVRPYWDPSVEVKVCAFDAQSAATAVDARGRTVDCSRTGNVKGCGCGPNLRWCGYNNGGVNDDITAAMNEQLLRYIDRIVRDDRPYTEVVLGKDLEINGPLAHWLNHQAQTQGFQLLAGPAQNYPVPDLEFSDQAWTPVTQGTRHAGILSLPGYLLKFQSDRGRANRFYNAFLCQHFETTESIPSASDPCHQQPDLTKRCGCKGCHLAVEPAAAYWGRWAEAGVLPLEEANFPRHNPACEGADARNPLCRTLYFTQADVTNPEIEGPWIGQLRAYVFADAAREANIAAGPEGIARAAVDSGRYATCTVQRMWQFLMAREPTVEEEATVAALTTNFTADYRLRSLIKAIVTRPEYVEGGRFGEEE